MAQFQMIADRRMAVQYTGTNGAEIDTLFGGDFTITSDDGETLEFTFQSVPRTVDAGGWIITGNAGSIQSVYSDNNEFVNAFMLLPSMPEVSAIGVSNVPSLLLGQDVDIDVALSREMDGTGYTAGAALVGARGNLTVNNVTGLDASTVRVNVSASLAYVAGAQVIAIAHGDVA